MVLINNEYDLTPQQEKVWYSFVEFEPEYIVYIWKDMQSIPSFTFDSIFEEQLATYCNWFEKDLSQSYNQNGWNTLPMNGLPFAASDSSSF